MSKEIIKQMLPQRYSAQGKTEWRIKPLEKISAVVYTDDGEHVFYASAYTRKALKPAFNYRFHSRQRRDDYVAEWVDSLVKREARKQADRDAKKKAHTLVVGDVLNTSWGYDQTNVEYYQVVALKSKTMVTLREIGAISVDDSHVKPSVDNFKGEAFSKRVDSTYNSIKISSSQRATPVSKDEQGNYKASYRTSAYAGH